MNKATPAGVELGLDDLYELLAHLVTSAEICTFEPWFYGTFRLIDAAARLSGLAIARGVDDGWLRDFHQELEVKKTWMMSDRPAYFRFLEESSQRMAQRLLERHESAPSRSPGERPSTSEPRA